jgi:uncharacterized membrane protein YeaQ/YmgE (transglycosylase-associated protein family)
VTGRATPYPVLRRAVRVRSPLVQMDRSVARGYLVPMVVLLVVLVVLLVVLPIVGWALWLLISAAIVGAIIGGLARLVLPGHQDIGVFSTVVIGWIGSLVGSLLGRHLFHVGAFLSVLCEIGVSVVLVAIASSGVGNAVAKRNSGLRR